MTKNFKSPGVYIQEKSAFPNSVVAVATAVPAFVGYTEMASRSDSSLRNIPTRITSLAEYHQYFGKGPNIKYQIKSDPAEHFSLEEIHLTKYDLYHSISLFFANGGTNCYIVSVGYYTSIVNKDELNAGINTLLQEPEPTMLVIPDAVNLNKDDCFILQKAMLNHCGSEMKNRIALLDVFGGDKDRSVSPKADVIMQFREGIGEQFLQWGAAYYPWLNTTIVPAGEINFKKNINNLDVLSSLLTDHVNKEQTIGEITEETAELLKAEIEKIENADTNEDVAYLHQTLTAVSPLYTTIIAEIRSKINIIPPGAVMAGVMSMVDNAVGVWKAPANVSINSVTSPTINITADHQEDLNSPVNGKAINAIRAFPGKGVLVWGARTLDGNSQDWKYINVRRTVIMIEQSIKAAIKAFVFEPNENNTWVKIKGMISSFLTDQWKQGALSGSVPEDAFSVDIGLGVTMTGEDILERIMNISVKIAVVRPAEFMVITFQQQMQKS